MEIYNIYKTMITNFKLFSFLIKENVQKDPKTMSHQEFEEFAQQQYAKYCADDSNDPIAYGDYWHDLAGWYDRTPLRNIPMDEIEENPRLFESVTYTLEELLAESPIFGGKVVEHILDYLGVQDRTNVTIESFNSDNDFKIHCNSPLTPIAVELNPDKPEIRIDAQNTASVTIENPYFNKYDTDKYPGYDGSWDSMKNAMKLRGEIDENLNENNDVTYYQELVDADKARLKNATGGEAELIMQNLQFNRRKLAQAKREANPPAKKPKGSYATPTPKEAPKFLKKDKFKFKGKSEIYQITSVTKSRFGGWHYKYCLASEAGKFQPFIQGASEYHMKEYGATKVA
jgi:hypothetical protein